MARASSDGILISRGIMLAELAYQSDAFPRCAHCGGVIGVYEPAIHVVAGGAWTTSRAADPDLSTDDDGLLYHAVCFELGRYIRS